MEDKVKATSSVCFYIKSMIADSMIKLDFLIKLTI